MINLTLALSNMFNPRRQGKLAPICDPLLLMPAHKLSSMIKDGQLTSVRLCELVSDRIKQVQPLINAMCQERFSAALEEAQRIDTLLADIRSGAKQQDINCSEAERQLLDSPLLGVPISVKESIQVKGMRNSCGLWDRRQIVADEDAICVQNVRRFGMIPICTTNVPECTLFWADCQNRVYGRTLNPYDQSRITGASSGGEGALLGSGASILGIGSDIGGSLRIPAHYCGVYSHKPSPFLVSSEGNFPQLKEARLRMFTLGPMCRYASDLKPLLKCLLRDKDNAKQDTYYKHQPANIGQLRKQLIARLDEPLDLTKVKIYYFNFNEISQLQGKQSVRVNDELMLGQQEVLNHFVTKFNCTIEQVNLDNYFKKALITWQCMLRCASKEDRDEAYEDNELEHLFGINSMTLELLKMTIGLSKHTKESVLALILGSAVPRDRTKAFELCEKFEAHGQELRNEINKLLSGGNNDTSGAGGGGQEESVLIMPTLPTVAYKHNVSLMKTPDVRFPSLFNVLQLPVSHATIGLDKAHGLPYGVSIATRPYQDHVPLAVAEEIELAFGGWTPPSSSASSTNSTTMPSGAAAAAAAAAAAGAALDQNKAKVAAAAVAVANNNETVKIKAGAPEVLLSKTIELDQSQHRDETNNKTIITTTTIMTNSSSVNAQ